ncbi:MAG: LamG domain-containing protein [Bacteroidetes bacterium]|nr:LamG domain-containing protein [Bacteroidota bacterium]
MSVVHVRGDLFRGMEPGYSVRSSHWWDACVTIRGLLLLLAVICFISSSDVHAQNAGDSYELVPPNQGLQLLVGAWMEIPDNPTLVLDTFTAECWVKATSRIVIVSRDKPGNAQPDWSVVYEAVNQRIEFMTGMNSQPDSYFWTPHYSFRPNVWNHLALVVNGPAGNARCYINGNLSATFSFQPRHFTVVTGLAWGGYFQNYGGATGAGFLDECRYWSGERTQAEIQSYMARRLIDLSQLPNLMGFWRFCGNYLDETTHANHGQPQGNPAIVDIPDLPMGITCEALELGVIADPVRPICKGETILLHAEAYGGRPPYQFVWSPIQFLRSPYSQSTLATPPYTIRYVVTVYDADGMHASDSVLVEVLPEVIIDAGPDLEFCGVQSFSLSARAIGGQPPYRFTWDPHPTLAESERNKQNPNVTPLLPGTYTYVVKVEDFNGCTDQDSVTVTIHEGLDVDLGPDHRYCGDRDIILFTSVLGGTAPFRYEWSPDSLMDLSDPSAPVVHPRKPTRYSVRVTDAHGCIGEDSIEVQVFDAVELLIAGADRLCKPGDIWLRCSVRSGKPPFKVQWSPEQLCATPDSLATRVTVQSTTTFTIHVVDANGCSSEVEHTVELHEGLEVDLPPTRTVCRGDSILLQGTVIGGRPPLAVQWEPAAFVLDAHALETAARADSTMKFYLHVVDVNGCEGRDSMLVTVSDGPVVSAGQDVILCRGDSARLHGSASGGVPPYTFQWTPSIGLLSSSSERDPLVRPDASILYILRVTDAAGCAREDSVRVVVLDNAQVDIRPSGNRNLCDGDSLVLVATGGYARYQWLRDGSPLPDTTRTLTVRAGGVYTVRVWTEGGCEAIAPSVTVWLHPALHPSIVVIGANPFCEGDSVTLTTDRPYRTYRWLDELGQEMSQNESLRVGTSAQVHVVVTDTGICPGISDPVRLIAVSGPPAEIVGPLVICHGETASYSTPLLPGDSCIWEVGGGAVISTEPPGNLTVRWTADTTGWIRITALRPLPGGDRWCDVFKEINIRISRIPEPRLSLDGDSVFCEGQAVLLRTEPGYARYEWQTPAGTISGTEILAASSAGTYSVTAINADGCTGSSPPMTLTALPAPSVSLEGRTLLCPGAREVYHAIAGPGTAFRWLSSGGIVESGVIADSLIVHWPESGKYMLTVTADDGICQRTDTLMIVIADSVHPRIMPEGPVTLCEGDSIALDAGSGFIRYEWQTPWGPESRQIIQARMPGVYLVRVVSVEGCEGISDPVLILVNAVDKPLITGPSELCDGDSVQLTASRGYVRYMWSNGMQGPSITVRSEGWYRVTVTDSNGCASQSADHFVRVWPPPVPPVITRTVDSLHCTTAMRYEWYVNGTRIPDSDRSSIPVTQPGNYRVITVDENGCPALSEILVIDRLIEAFTLIGLPVLEAEPGEVIQVPLSILDETALSQLAPTRFHSILSFDESVMLPVGNTPPGVTENGIRKIELESGYGGGMQLAGLEFMVTLGTTAETPLRIDHFDWAGTPVRVRTQNGLLRVRICREGGERLFDGTHYIGLEQNNPNPATSQTTIRYSLLTAGAVRLILIDSYGRHIATLVDAVQEAGEHTATVDLRSISSGIYRYELHTGTGTRQRLMVVTH